MKRRIFAALLAGAMILSLAACGGGNGAASSNPGSGSDVSAAAPGGSSSQPDGSTPDGSQPDASNDIPTINESDIDISLTLNKTEVTLKKAGATFQLNWTVNPIVEMRPTFTSSDETVARVNDQGKITAVAPGTAVITVEQRNITDVETGEHLSAACTVTCDWKEASKPEPKPEPKPDPKPDASNPGGGSGSSGGSSSSGSSDSSSSQVDLQKFYDDTTGKYQFSFMTEADDTTLTNFFAGLSDLSLSQQVIYLCGMSPAPVGDFALVQVSDSKDVDTVKSIFQARINYMVGDGNGPGGAWYPGPTDMWENQSRIVTNGNYVMLIVHENCDDIVKEFNALF